MYLRRFYFIILVYANLKMEYDTKDKTFWKRKGNDMKVLLGAVNAKYIHSNLAVYCLKAYAEKYGVRHLDWMQGQQRVRECCMICFCTTGIPMQSGQGIIFMG